MKKSILLISLALLPFTGYSQNVLPDWALGGFVRPEKANPIITPNPSSQFDCPMQGKKIGWEESDVFNPAATVRDGKICILYRAEDNSATGIGKRTSRIGLAESEDGIHVQRRSTPVLYPDKDNMKEYEWPGGCEDPRVAMTEEGVYVMAYTSWNRKVPRLCIATSRDLIKWEKHGPAFAKAYNGRFKDMACKSGSMVTKIEHGKQVLAKIDGKYFMYWGEHMVGAATSDDLVNWTPVLDDKNELAVVIKPRDQYFDSALTECGPPAVMTDKGIVLLYNGKNQTNDHRRDKRFTAGAYCAGQILTDAKDPMKVLQRLDVPFFRPMASFEKSGQYVDGTVFIEGLVFFKNKWYLYYGCADSQVGVAVYDPEKKTPGDQIPGSLTQAQTQNYYRNPDKIYLDSKSGHNGNFSWQMYKADEIKDPAEKISRPGYQSGEWMPAIVPGTVLNSLVHNKVYPEPYYGLNNKLDKDIIPDLAKVGREFYTYWFRTEFNIPESYKDKIVWLQVDGINYRAEIWVNGQLLSCMSGMFRQDYINITDYAQVGKANALAIKVYPVDVPGTIKPKRWGAVGEFHNGGDGNIGLNTTMLMSVGWDFTFNDGIRDRNTGIWKNISLYATDKAVLRNPFIKSDLAKPSYDLSRQTVSVEVTNPTQQKVKCLVKGEIVGENISFSKEIEMFRGERKEVTFTADEFPQLIIKNPRLWWPLFKGKPELYELKMTALVDGKISDEVKTRFGIREITSDQNTPDQSRQFYVNGKKVFIRGTNWIPEGMLRTSDERTYAELRYTKQSGINLIRMWGGGIAESDYFFQLCDEMGFLVWQEFWMTGDTKHPHDADLYLSNVEATVKRLRNHPSLAYYVSSNESTEMPGAKDLIMKLDGTRGYQMQSECDGVHDGSPYKQVNPMQHYENTASERGSRVDGFNPEYGAPTIPTVETLREVMDEKDLWPINKEVWDYHDGGGFHLMTSMYTDLTNNYGTSSSIEEFVAKGQLVGAMNSKSIWEVWNYNKFDYGDRYASGLLFWYHNCPVRQVCARMWDYSLEPTASLYHTQNALAPLHPQFDYLKNTVSVYNDYYRSFKGYKVTAEVYDIKSKKVWAKSQAVDLPEDGVANDVFVIDFPANISQVHFIKLYLYDDKGKLVSDNFYWRSNDKYEGSKTLTGPTSSGFESLADLKEVALKVKSGVSKKEDWQVMELSIQNPSSSIAFFVQLQYIDQNGKPVRPSFYSDNFFSLLPGESKKVVVETALKNLPEKGRFIVKGWNVKSQDVKVVFAR